MKLFLLPVALGDPIEFSLPGIMIFSCHSRESGNPVCHCEESATWQSQKLNRLLRCARKDGKGLKLVFKYIFSYLFHQFFHKIQIMNSGQNTSKHFSTLE